MRHYLCVFLLVVLNILTVNAQSYSLTVVLHKADVSQNKDRTEWLVSLSNSATTAIRFSHFSLASAIRAAKFFDDTGNEWQVIRPKDIIDPPSPDVDYRLRIPAKSVVSLTIRTEKLELLPRDGEMAATNQYPETLMYKLERDIEILDDITKRSSWWIGLGNGIVRVLNESRSSIGKGPE